MRPAHMDTIGENSASLVGLWRPTEREQKAYTHMLSLVDTNKEGIVRGQQAVPFFQKSGLPDSILGGIWQLADTEGKGHLTAHEFGAAMKLISLAQAHKPVQLRNLNDEAQLPEMKGVDMSHFSGHFGGMPQSIASNRSASFSSGTGVHARRDSNTSNFGWTSTAGSSFGGIGGDDEAIISLKEKVQYQQLFEKSHPVDGAISGETARALFTKSKLSNEQLSSVWRLGDPHAEGKLRLPGFIVAMYYIRRIMENRNFALPTVCPVSLWRSAGGDIPLKASLASNFSQSSLLGGGSTSDLTFGGLGQMQSQMQTQAQWDVSKDEQTRYEQFFRSLDTSNAGFLTGDVPVNFFLKSKLPEHVLSKVWDLADINRNGKLTKDEFSVAMHLINLRLVGKEIPDTLPATLVPPYMRKAGIVSSSMSNLSPQLRPASARDRLHMESLKRTTSYAAHARGNMPGPISRSSTARSPGPLSPVADESEISALQTQLGQMEDMSRGLQAQRTAAANQIALAGSRKQELEVKISALQSSHEAESRINQELQEKLRGEEARVGALQTQVAEANRKLSIVSAQRSQLEQDVHRVQQQQLALQQKLQQAQDDGRQLTNDISALEQQKRHLEQTITVMQSQIKQQEEANKSLSEQAQTLKTDVTELTQTSTSLSQTTASLSQVQTQGKSTAETEALSFDEVFGTNDSPVYSPSNASFGDMFQSMPLPPTQPISTDPRKSPILASSASPQQRQQDLSPSAVLSGMPGFGPAAAMPTSLPMSTSAHMVASTDAFDSFGAHEKDPFEEFLQAVASPETSAQAASDKAAGGTKTVSSFDAVFSDSTASRGVSADPRSVSSTPAPPSGAFAATFTTPASAMPPLSASAAKSTPTSPQLDAAVAGAKKTGAQALDFTADFNSAFGTMPGASERAINRELEEFDSQFPDIDALSVSEEKAKPVAAAAAAENEDAEKDLTFESVFGAKTDQDEGALASATEAEATAAENSETSDQTNGNSSSSKKPDAKDNNNDSDDDSNFVPPPVVKRAIVSARPMSRVLSIFRSSSNNKASSALDSNTPAMPRRATASEKRQQQSREQDKKFEEQWAKGDWPEWVKHGDHLNERRMLVEMGYPKDRVVEALEVNDFNLAQATDYLLSS
ncbi:hypothetical protein GGF40_001972 [Coemansia sp. RSA 1286]|nr:hypothetical protein GGF40_001972 [Coemansia sp. RSA 1286]